MPLSLALASGTQSVLYIYQRLCWVSNRKTKHLVKQLSRQVMFGYITWPQEHHARCKAKINGEPTMSGGVFEWRPSREQA